MKQNRTQLEILLVTDSHFLSGETLAKDGSEKDRPGEKERLLEACWNGLLYDILPEVIEPASGNEKLWLWQIKEAAHFLEFDLGQFEEDRDMHFSIDPYRFLAVQSYC